MDPSSPFRASSSATSRSRSHPLSSAHTSTFMGGNNLAANFSNSSLTGTQNGGANSNSGQNLNAQNMPSLSSLNLTQNVNSTQNTNTHAQSLATSPPEKGGQTPRPEYRQDTCSICLEKYTDENPSMGYACGHAFHLQCAEAWRQRSDMCPLCWKVLAEQGLYLDEADYYADSASDEEPTEQQRLLANFDHPLTASLPRRAAADEFIPRSPLQPHTNNATQSFWLTHSGIPTNHQRGATTGIELDDRSSYSNTTATHSDDESAHGRDNDSDAEEGKSRWCCCFPFLRRRRGGVPVRVARLEP